MNFAKASSDLPDLDRLREMSGREAMEAMLSGEIPGPPIAQSMNFSLDTVDDGATSFLGTPRFAHSNPMGQTHGGWYGTILDSAMACAVMTKVPRGSIYTTLEYKISLCRALPADREVRVTGEVIHAGRTTSLARGEIRCTKNGTLYATGTTTCLIMALPAA